jgi:hypothetical protein
MNEEQAAELMLDQFKRAVFGELTMLSAYSTDLFG